MNRIEEYFSKVEKLYSNARNRLSRAGSDWDPAAQTTSYTDDTVKVITKFQRELELLYEDTKKLSDEKTDFYVKRCAESLELIRTLLQGEEEWSGVYHQLDNETYREAYDEFIKIRSLIYNIFEDVKLIYALRIYPVEEKMALRSDLSDRGFQDVVMALDDAENNLVEKHLKDCLTRCREALEKLVSSTLKKEGKKPCNRFSIDISTLCNVGIIDRDEKRLIEPTYSYLSEVGAHGRAKKLTLGDANYAMKETYMRIALLVKRYREYVSKKKKARKRPST